MATPTLMLKRPAIRDIPQLAVRTIMFTRTPETKGSYLTVRPLILRIV